MHNLHILVVKAESGREACSIAAGSIEDWGNENNWRCFGGAISEKGEIHLEDHSARWSTNDLSKIEAINALFEEQKSARFEDYFLKTSKSYLEDKEVESGHWHYAALFCEEMDHIQNRPKGFNVFEHEHKPGQYDEFGATHLFNNNVDCGSLWAVLCDMHS